MQINKIDKQVLKLINTAKIIRKAEIGAKERKYMQEACYKLGDMLQQPASRLQTMTKEADAGQFTFLKTMVNKFNHIKKHNINDDSEHILNIYSMVDRPTATHLNIVRKSNDSFEAIEKIFSLAKDKETLQYVEDLQYSELKNSDYASKIIIDLLSSKNKDRYITNPDRYSSYIELHSNDKNAIEKLDELINTGKFSRLKSDAQLAIQKLFKNKRVNIAMSGKTSDLEKMYTKDREKFLTSLIKNFIPATKQPNEETKAIVIDMYGSLNSNNSQLRNAIMQQFKQTSIKDKTAEIIQMQTLFNKIDNNNDAKKFVQKAINKDLKVNSIEELNEIVNTVPLKKANIFFNNVKRIVELSTGEERKQALVVELENPFFQPKTEHKTRMIRMFDNKYKDNFFTTAYKLIENKINQYKYYKLSA